MKENIHIKVHKDKKEEIMRCAKDEGLTMTAYILTAINDRLRKSGGPNVHTIKRFRPNSK